MAIDLLGNLQSIGIFYDFVLPWLLFFAVILGVLKTSKIPTDDVKINSIIAAVIAFFIVSYVPFGGIAKTYGTLFGAGGLILGTLLVLVLFAGILGYKPDDMLKGGGNNPEYVSKWIKPLIGLLLVVFVFFVFQQATGGSSGISISDTTLTYIFVGVFVVAVLWFAQSGGTPAKKDAQGNPIS